MHVCVSVCVYTSILVNVYVCDCLCVVRMCMHVCVFCVCCTMCVLYFCTCVCICVRAYRACQQQYKLIN